LVVAGEPEESEAALGDGGFFEPGGNFGREERCGGGIGGGLGGIRSQEQGG
jgi:hypothetical protein